MSSIRETASTSPGGRLLKQLLRQRAVTLMVVPDSGNDIRTMRVRPARVAAACLVFGLVVAAGLAWMTYGGSFFAEHGMLAQENAVLRARLAGLDADLERLRGRLVEAHSLEERMRLMAGVEPLDDEMRLMGVGGPDFTAMDPLHQLNEEIAVEVSSTRLALDGLLRQSELTRYSYLEVLEALEQQSDHWARVPSISPVAEGRITSGYGRRTDPFTKRRALHRGIDLSARRGAPIVATADGKVIFAGKNSNYGLTVKIDHGNGMVTLYAHILDLKVKKGQRVKRGQEIARVGSTGRATAPHVHYEVRVDDRTVNPRQYMLDERVALN